MRVLEEWVQKRAEILMTNEFQTYEEDQLKVKIQKKSQMSYPIANRAARNKLTAVDMQKS